MLECDGKLNNILYNIDSFEDKLKTESFFTVLSVCTVNVSPTSSIGVLLSDDTKRKHSEIMKLIWKERKEKNND